MARIIMIQDSESQSIRATTEINGANLTLYFRFRFHSAINQWIMDIADEMGNEIVNGIPLLVMEGEYNGNLLKPYEHLGIGKIMVAPLSDAERGVDPGVDSLKDKYYIVWG
jgi:hypothetical protein